LAEQDVLDYITMLCNPTHKHTNNDILSPADYEIKHPRTNNAGFSERGTADYLTIAKFTSDRPNRYRKNFANLKASILTLAKAF
jgi:hypothetical protein